MRHTIKIIREDPSQSSKELADTININRIEPISSSIVRRNLCKLGLRSYSARKKPLLTRKMRKKRLQWCKKYQHKTSDFWNRVLFTDETMIELNLNSIMNRVRRFSLDNPYQKRFIAEKVKNPQKVMFWAGISANHITKLIPYEGIVNSRKYIETIIDPEVASLSLSDPELILQQDNAPCHTSKSVKDFLMIKIMKF